MLAVSLVVCTSCSYDPEYDALSVFPGNRAKLIADDMTFVQPDIEDKGSADNLSSVVSQEPVEIDRFAPVEIEQGVTGVLFRDSMAVDGSKNFTLLPSTKTGIPSFKNRFKEQNADKLNSPFTAAGLASADFDGDGLTDVLIVDQFVGVKLFRNGGDFWFEDVTQASGIEIESMWGTSATIVDINCDGLLDFYLCGYDSPNKLFINRGRKFVERAASFGLDFRGASVSAAFSDYDRDGDLDMYLVTHRLYPQKVIDQLPVDREPGKAPRIKEEFRELNHLIPYKDGSFTPVESGQYDYLFRNDESRFEDVTSEAFEQKLPFMGMSAIWFDFDRNGWPDLYVSNDGKDDDQLFVNQGPDGNGVVRFVDEAENLLKQVSLFAKGVDVADLNGDEFLEVFVGGNSKIDPLEAIVSRGNLFGKKSDSWFLRNGKPAKTFGNCIHLNERSKLFSNVARTLNIGNTDCAWTIRAIDFDNDGYQDLFVGNGSPRQFLNNDANREIERLISDEQLELKSEYWEDKRPKPSTNALFRNRGGLQFQNVSESAVDGLPADVTQCVSVNDFDNDGDLDLLTGGFDDSIRFYRNNQVKFGSIQIKLKGRQSNTFGIGAVCKLSIGDGSPIQTQTVVSNRGLMTSEEPVLHFGVGESEKIESIQVTWPSGTTQVVLGLKADYRYEIEEPGDGGFVGRGIKMDIEKSLFSNESINLDNSYKEELEFDDFAKQPMLPNKFSKLGPCLAWGDIDGDGDYDVFIGGSMFEPGRIFENIDGQRFSSLDIEVFAEDAMREDTGAVFFDFDRDGDSDLYVVSGGVEGNKEESYIDRLYVNKGGGDFVKAPESVLPSLINSGMSVSASDFNLDGNIDLFVGGRIVPGRFPNSPRSILLRNAGGKLVDVTESVAPELAECGMVTSSVWSDIDNDGRPDLLVSLDWGGIKVFKNVGGKLVDFTKRCGLGELKGMFNSIAAGDFDNDGDVDFVVGNEGTNTSQKIPKADLLRLRYGPFGPRGKSALVKSFQFEGREYAANSLDALSESIGFDSTIESSRDFSKKPIEEVFDVRQLEESKRLDVTEFRSGVLVNNSSDGEPKFSFKSLPELAQISPVQGCQVVDVNGDGNLDIYMLQNEYGTGLWDEQSNNGSGLLLIGDGTGDFRLPEFETGMMVPGVGRALTVVDLNEDARPDFVAAQTDSDLEVFVNRSGHVPLGIDVRKISGRKNYVGTKVMIEFDDGSKQLHEVAIGSGYISQNPPIIYSGLKMKDGIRSINIIWPDGTTKSGTVKSLFNKR